MWFLKIILFVSAVGMIQDLVTTEKKQTRIHHVKVLENNNGQDVATVKKINLNLISKTLTPY